MKEFVRKPKFYAPVNLSFPVFPIKLFSLDQPEICKSAKRAFVLQYYRTDKQPCDIFLEIAW